MYAALVEERAVTALLAPPAVAYLATSRGVDSPALTLKTIVVAAGPLLVEVAAKVNGWGANPKP